MKKWFTLVVAVSLLGFTACSGGTSKEKSVDVSTEKGKFTLKAPADTSLNQGESKEITVSADRKDFKDAIGLDFSKLPKGVTVEGEKTIAKDSDKAKLTLKADKDAPKVEDNTVEVKGSGGGSSGTVKFKVTVKEKK